MGCLALYFLPLVSAVLLLCASDEALLPKVNGDLFSDLVTALVSGIPEVLFASLEVTEDAVFPVRLLVVTANVPGAIL